MRRPGGRDKKHGQEQGRGEPGSFAHVHLHRTAHRLPWQMVLLSSEGLMAPTAGPAVAEV
jgi:hypothetical protein